MLFKHSIKKIFVFLLFIPILAYAKGLYKTGDWVSFTAMHNVTALTYDFQYVYVGTTGGIARFDRFKLTWDTPFTVSDGLSDNRIRRLAYDPATGLLWADTYRGVCSYNPTLQLWVRESFFPDSLNLFIKSIPGSTKYLTEFGYDYLPDGYITDFNLRRYPVVGYMKDSWNNLWIATAGLGVGLVKNYELDLKFYRFGLLQDDITSLCFDGDSLWFAGYGNYSLYPGLTLYERKNDSWSYFEAPYQIELYNIDVNTVLCDSYFVWFGTQQGFLKFDKKNKKFKNYTTFSGLPADEVYSLALDKNLLLIGTRSGLSLLDINKDALITLKDKNIRQLSVYSILVDSNTTWIGTDQGVFRMDKSIKKWFLFTAPGGVLNGKVKSIVKSGNLIWFGTNRGILAWDLLSSKSYDYTVQVSYPLNNFNSLAVDSASVWIATLNGVWRLIKNTGEWKIYTEDDGLLDNRVYDLALDKDYIWFATPSGVTRFYWNNPLRIVE